MKGFCTENGIDIASIGIQVHGGMGYVEETGAAQTFRDARITSIYEGTTGIQSNDLIGRKFGRDRGAALLAFIDEMQASLTALRAEHAAAVQARDAALDARRAAAKFRGHIAGGSGHLARSRHGGVGAVPQAVRLHHRRLAHGARARTLRRSKLAGGASDREFFEAKLASAHFYATQVLPQVLALEQIVSHGSDAVVGTDAALI